MVHDTFWFKVLPNAGALSATKAMAGKKRDGELIKGIFIVFITSIIFIFGTDVNPPLADGARTIDETYSDARLQNITTSCAGQGPGIRAEFTHAEAKLRV